MPQLAPSSVLAVDKPAATRDNLRESLLSWYDRHGRDLPWRVRDGRPDPYKVWLSEIMLQQTTVAVVGPYFARFLELFPAVDALASAPRSVVLEAWAGLGYYSRARNLHEAARRLTEGGFPVTEQGWRELPGVGPYTAAAIAAIAFDQAANVVDGNVERVMARLFAVAEPLPAAKPRLRALARELVTEHRPGDWAQALMDLGATVCTPRSPNCPACPWQGQCAAYAAGAAEALPRRVPKAQRPRRHGIAYRLEKEGALWLVRRPDQGLLGGMAALPTTEWREKKWTAREARSAAPLDADWRYVGEIRHTFTHFALTLEVYAAEGDAPEGEGWWGDVSGLPAVFKKAALVR